MKNNQITIHNNVKYKYTEFYKRLQIMDDKKLKAQVNKSIIPHILCPICYNDTFKLQYGNYEINAICKCGHKMTVYDG